MIDPDTDPSENTFDDISDDIEPDMQILPPEKTARYGIGMKTALLMSLVAAIAGALGGAAIAEAIRYKSAPNIEKFQNELSTLSSEREALSAQLSRTQSQVQTLSTKKPANLGVIEARLKTLETNRQPNSKNIKKLESRIAAIESRPQRAVGASDAAGSGDAAKLGEVKASNNFVPSDIEARLEVLESRSSPYDMNDIMERLDRLEVQSVTPIAAPAVKAKPLIKTLIIPPLPQSKILVAIAEQEKESGSWIGRTLKKHVSIREAGTDSPEAIMAEIQTAMDNEDYAAALKAFDKLPSRARSAASEWQDAVQTKLKGNP